MKDSKRKMKKNLFYKKLESTFCAGSGAAKEDIVIEWSGTILWWNSKVWQNEGTTELLMLDFKAIYLSFDEKDQWDSRDSLAWNSTGLWQNVASPSRPMQRGHGRVLVNWCSCTHRFQDWLLLHPHFFLIIGKQRMHHQWGCMSKLHPYMQFRCCQG